MSHQCKEFSQFDQGRIVGAYQVCCNKSQVARLLGMPFSTVAFWIIRFEQSGSAASKSRSGRPRKTSLYVNALQYCDVLHGFFATADLPAHCLFQQDNAPIHRAWMTTQMLEDLEVQLLPWPSRSPDLNPIEHVWDILGRRMQHRSPGNLNQLFEALQEEWDAIPQDDLDRLISSMPRRVGEVISKRGSHTRY